MAKSGISVLFKFLLVFSLVLEGLCININGGDFRVFYFMQQWLGSYCNQKGTKCCYPPTGKPGSDFTIYGLWPYYSDGSFPHNCPGASFDESLLKPLEIKLQKAWPSFTCPQIGRKFWLHEWNKHGTCTKSILDELPYFHAALDLRDKTNLLQALGKAGIRPNNQSYPLTSIKAAIARATGFDPWVSCNTNAQGNSQLWQVSLCVDRSGSELVNCPFIPDGHNGCASTIMFPSY